MDGGQLASALVADTLGTWPVAVSSKRQGLNPPPTAFDSDERLVPFTTVFDSIKLT